MIRRLGVFWSTGALLATTFVALSTVGMSAAHAVSFEDWANVSAGGYHSCGVRTNGKLYCWGSNGSGQVGNGDDPTSITAPLHIGTLEDWATVAAGNGHSCGVRKNGKLYCWGSDYYGQVGDGDPAENAVTAPRHIGTFEDWADVSAGYDHTCGVRKNGKLYCWGLAENGRLGEGSIAGNVTAPKRIGTFEDWDNVSASEGHTCGVRKNGKLYCWGSDGVGQVGDGEGDSSPVATPRRIGTYEDWANVTAGGSHTCGVRRNGKLYCWGYDGVGQVGDGGPNDYAIKAPRRIGSFEDWASADAGSGHTCGVRANGKLYCWGGDGYGQVGDGDGANATTPRRIGSFEDWANASASAHTCGVRSNGKLYCWGYDYLGQIGDGDGDSTPVASPRRI